MGDMELGEPRRPPPMRENSRARVRSLLRLPRALCLSMCVIYLKQVICLKLFNDMKTIPHDYVTCPPYYGIRYYNTSPRMPQELDDLMSRYVCMSLLCAHQRANMGKSSMERLCRIYAALTYCYYYIYSICSILIYIIVTNNHPKQGT